MSRRRHSFARSRRLGPSGRIHYETRIRKNGGGHLFAQHVRSERHVFRRFVAFAGLFERCRFLRNPGFGRRGLLFRFREGLGIGRPFGNRIQFLLTPVLRRRKIFLAIRSCRRIGRLGYGRRPLPFEKIPSRRTLDSPTYRDRFFGKVVHFVRGGSVLTFGEFENTAFRLRFGSSAFRSGMIRGYVLERRLRRRCTVFVPVGFGRRNRHRAFRSQAFVLGCGNLPGNARRFRFRGEPRDREGSGGGYGKSGLRR